MYNLVKPISVGKELERRGIRILTSREFAALFHLNGYQAEYALSELVGDRLLQRLKKGVYMVKTDSPNEKEIANALYRPSYISFDYALAYYHLIPEAVYQITSATTKSTRLFTTDTLAFGYYTIKVQAYTGYVLKQEGNRKFLIAEPEKAVVDYLYALCLGKRGRLGDRYINDRLDISNLDQEKLLGYAKLYAWAQLDKELGRLLGRRGI